MAKQFSPTKRAVQDYMHQLRREWHLSIPAFLLPGIAIVLVFYVPPLIIAALLKRSITSDDFTAEALTPYILAFAGIWSAGEILWRIAIHFLIKIDARSIERLYRNAMHDILQKDLSFFHDNFAGSLTKKTISYAKSFENFSDTLVLNVVSQIIPLGFVSYILWIRSPLLVVALIGLLCLTALCIFPLIRRRQKLVNKREAAANTVSGHISDIYSNIDAVRAFAHERYEEFTHARHVRDWATKAKKSWDYQNLRVDFLTSPLYVFTNLVGLLIALRLGHGNVESISTIFITFSYYAGFTRVVWDFNQIYRRLESSITEAAQFTELFKKEPTIWDPIRPEQVAINKGHIKFNNVSFQYKDEADEESYLFQNLNLDIKPGEKIGLVGRSGGGKTTITKLLLRFMDIDSGSITIDGQNISNITQVDLRSRIAYVPQDPVMFHRSIAENIRYGKLNATAAEILQSSRRAHAAEFVDRLPHRYDTLIGERGIKLSGGQRQRIAIARAMIKQAPILLLDEATSALDSESENLIQDALWKLMEGRTAIVIAHRLSTIQKMDRIVVLEKGRIVEEGTHHSLLSRNGIYAKLWAHQSGGFLED